MVDGCGAGQLKGCVGFVDLLQIGLQQASRNTASKHDKYRISRRLAGRPGQVFKVDRQQGSGWSCAIRRDHRGFDAVARRHPHEILRIIENGSLFFADIPENLEEINERTGALLETRLPLPIFSLPISTLLVYLGIRETMPSGKALKYHCLAISERLYLESSPLIPRYSHVSLTRRGLHLRPST